MKHIAAILIVILGVSASAEERKKSFDAFNLMKTRNIFDPNRRPVRVEPQREREVREFRSRPNWIALTGTMVTDDKALAFFNSSRVEARKVAGVGEMVGDFKLLSVTPVQVEWEHEGKRSVLAVGRQVDVSGTTNDPIEPPPADAASEHPPEGDVPAGDISQPPRPGDTPIRNSSGQSRDRSESRDRERGNMRDRGQRERGSQSRDNAQPPSNGTFPNASPSSSSDPSEVARKMAERRQKELSK